MEYSSLVYNLLQSAVWGITPALPVGAPGTRLAVGTPEPIPDVTFVARRVTAADGVTPAAEVTRLNGYIDGAMRYHTLYGLAPISTNAFEDILEHFRTITTPIGRIRFVSHGDNAFIWCPVFVGGKWNFGMQEDFLKALKDSDEDGLRFLFRGTVTSPMFTGLVDPLTDAIRASNSAVLAPFGIQASGSAPSAALPYFEIVSDLYQARYGTLRIQPETGTTLPFPTAAQFTIFTNALNRIEASVRTKLVGTVIAGSAITDPQLTAFRDAILAVAPGPFGLFGPRVDLPAGTVAAVHAATTATPQVENDIRSAFNGGTATEPVFGFHHLDSLVQGLEFFNTAVLNIGATPPLDLAAITADTDLNSLGLIGSDLFLLQNNVVIENGVALTNTQRTSLKNGLLALSNFIRARIVARSPAPFTAAQLNALRDALRNLDPRKSTILGWAPIFEPRVTDLQRATISMNGNFRTKLDHFRSLMKPSDASHFDVRGCLVGQSTSFLDTLRDFLGTATNRPVVSASDWFQSFPSANHWATNTAITPDIDNLVINGIPSSIRDVDVGTSLTTWRGLIDFDPHFGFIVALFATTASKRDFASLHWRVFQTAAAPFGIPVMRMQAKRVDDLDTLTLGNVIERFRIIYEIPAANAPNAATRTKLNSLQPHVVRFKTLSDAIAAASSPTSAQLTQFKTDLSTLLTSITAVALPGPAAPTAPSGATLADVQSFRGDIGTFIDALLDGALNSFFTAMQTATGQPNAPLHYYYNCGLPLILQNDAEPPTFRVSSMVSPGGSAGTDLVASSLRSWMRIQWQGDPAQTTTMNTRITNVAIGTDAQRLAATQCPMLQESETPTSPAALAPTPGFAAHIVTRPP
jgi:hypothetical protein